jgi:hypothetical protein
MAMQRAGLDDITLVRIPSQEEAGDSREEEEGQADVVVTVATTKGIRTARKEGLVTRIQHQYRAHSARRPVIPGKNVTRLLWMWKEGSYST